MPANVSSVSKPAVPLFDVVLSEDEIASVADTLRSGWLTLGRRENESK